MTDVGDILSDLLDKHATSGDVILADSKVGRRFIQQHKQSRLSKQLKKKTKADTNLLRTKERIVPDITMNAQQERYFLTIATKGVVELFSTLSQEQKTKKTKLNHMSKDNFLSMVKDSAVEGQNSLWDVLDENYMDSVIDNEDLSEHSTKDDFFHSEDDNDIYN